MIPPSDSIISGLSGEPLVKADAMAVRLFHSFEAALPFREAWNAVVMSSGADVYQTFDWCRLWWQYYGEGRQLHLLLFFEGDRLTGVIPVFVETLWLGPARLRMAKLVGSDFTLHLCNLPVVSSALEAAMGRAIRYFLGEQRCDIFLLGPLSGPAARLDILLRSGTVEKKLVETAEVLGGSCNTYFQLPASFDEYLKQIGKQQRGNFNRSVTQLGKARRVSVDVVEAPELLGKEFDAFCALHDAQWRAEGKMGHFGDWPKAREFNRNLVHTLGAQGMVRFHRILADDQIVSSQFCFVSGTTNYWRLPARVYGPEWDRLSFGRMGLARMIESSIGEGRRIIEGGRGHYAYKQQMGGCEEPLRTLQFVRRGHGVSTRLRLFKAFASVLNLAYYKVIFARLAPRVPALRRPLWPLWIRSTW